VPLFMDRHDIPGVTPEAVAQAHASDVAVADKHGVHFLAYWFDPDASSVFCFARAETADAVQTVHAESHGMLPNEVIAVGEADVLSFLGRVQEPTDASQITSPFRAILFTDLEGSTSLLDRLREASYMELLTEHDRIIRRALAEWNGREVKHTGDGVMASFTVVSDSLACALAIQDGFTARPVTADSPELRVRIGIDAGEPVDRGNDIFGRTVNLAARLCGAARGGEILVSEAVRRHPSASPFQFDEPAPLELHGFSDPVLADRVLGGPTRA
jgi:class 3 adenylate cyclase